MICQCIVPGIHINRRDYRISQFKRQIETDVTKKAAFEELLDRIQFDEEKFVKSIKDIISGYNLNGEAHPTVRIEREITNLEEFETLLKRANLEEQDKEVCRKISISYFCLLTEKK